ncbi:MAG: serine/threonine protein kinase [Candidatus Hydrogenedentes bacterium]|nr:serine/threonine protein kinase [Candidatus Hydrogenedentota bacterium]
MGQRVGDYKILLLLGQGTFGQVYLAEDVNLNRRVAIKFLKSARRSEDVQFFRREAKALASLSKHPNVVEIHHFGEYRGHSYFVLEYVESTLQQLQKEHPDGLPALQALGLTADCAEALAAAHDAHIIHRDVKPANILVEPGTLRAKLTDFGLARYFDTAVDVTVTPGSGTPKYMSPEQLNRGDLDGRTDIFSLGATLYELLSGSDMYAFPSGMSRVRAKPIGKILPDLHKTICRIVDKATADDRESRYHTSAEFARELRSAIAQIERTGAAGRAQEADRAVAGGKTAQGDPSPSSLAISGILDHIRGKAVLLGAAGALLLAVAVFVIMGLVRGGTDSPRLALETYCQAWARGDADAMYAVLSPAQQQLRTAAQWRQDIQRESTVMGSPVSWVIVGPVQDTGIKSLWELRITYSNERVGTLTKTTWLIREGNAFRIAEGGLVAPVLKPGFGRG